MYKIPGSNISIPGDVIETLPTKYPEAWWGMPMTVRLYRSVDVVRFAPGYSTLLGDWFAFSPTTNSPLKYTESHSIPHRGNESNPSLKQGAVWVLQRGTVLNVGRCAKLFGYPGGGYQAEFLDGPLPAIQSIRTLQC